MVSGIAKVSGKVVRGYQIASGRAADSPYPSGSIELQIPFFRSTGLDLSHCFAATLNIDVSPLKYRLSDADYVFKALNWIDGVTENFSVDVCQLEFAGKMYDGYIYYPHPETKPEHFHSDSIIEIISPRIPHINYGDQVFLSVNREHILLS